MSITEYSSSSTPKNRTPVKTMTVAKPAAAKDPFKNIKTGIWAYLIVLIFEGALRKWILPGLSTPLLVVRDPIVVWILYLAYTKGLIKPNKYMTGMVAIGLIGICTAMFAGHKNIYVAIYGARILALHFPLIFVIGRVFNRSDVIKMGKFILRI